MCRFRLSARSRKDQVDFPTASRHVRRVKQGTLARIRSLGMSYVPRGGSSASRSPNRRSCSPRSGADHSRRLVSPAMVERAGSEAGLSSLTVFSVSTRRGSRLQTGKPGTDVVRQEDRAGERHRRSRRGQGQLGCHVSLDRLEPKREAPQARSQDRLQAGGISCVSIDGADEEVSENANRMPLPLLPRSQIS